MEASQTPHARLEWPNGAPAHALSVRGGVGAPAAARRLVGAFVDDRLDPRRRHDALVLISELVTNAVRHGGAGPADRIEINLDLQDHRSTFEVCDSGAGFEPPDDPRPRPEGGGFGLVLMSAMSRSWGVGSRDDKGSCVWFALEH